MKKTFSIFLAFLILLGGLHISFATHYCGGEIAAIKLSVSGDLASCGMEENKTSCPMSGNQFKSHCCDDEVSVYSVDNTYAPSFAAQTELSPSFLNIFMLAKAEPFHLFSSSNIQISDVGPPGNLFSNAVSLVDICVFRI